MTSSTPTKSSALHIPWTMHSLNWLTHLIAQLSTTAQKVKSPLDSDWQQNMYLVGQSGLLWVYTMQCTVGHHTVETLVVHTGGHYDQLSVCLGQPPLDNDTTKRRISQLYKALRRKTLWMSIVIQCARLCISTWRGDWNQSTTTLS